MTKNILITGASRGIGAAIAEKLAKPGVRILINFKERLDRAEIVAENCRKKGADTLLLQADISNPKQVQTMFQTLNEQRIGVDVLINNAGISIYGLVQDISFEDWRRIFGVNVDGMFLVTKQCIPHMVSQKAGRIINISSIWGMVGASCESLYASTKGAIITFTKSLAKELAYSGITVNCIAPGVVDTEMLNQLDDEVKKSVAEEIPYGSFLTPSQIADWADHFASDGASFITGQIISPNGGMIII